MPLTIDLTPSDTFLVSDSTGHCVEVPATLSGLIFLKSTLAARRAYDKEPPLGTDARPSQAMVKAFLATHNVEKAPTALTAAQIAARKEADRKRLEAAVTRAAPFAHLDLELDL